MAAPETSSSSALFNCQSSSFSSVTPSSLHQHVEDDDLLEYSSEEVKGSTESTQTNTFQEATQTAELFSPRPSTQSQLSRISERSEGAARAISERTQNEIAPLQPYIAMVRANIAASERRNIFLVRGAERMDRIFPEWLTSSFTDQGLYTPKDLNQPVKLPERSGGPQDFHNDSPLTEMGQLTAQMLGRAFRIRQTVPRVVFSSPSLRCIQTAQAILRMIGDPDLQICIEPGLFEWRNWYGKLPRFMSPSELKAEGYSIYEHYQPVMTLEQLKKIRRERLDELYMRVGSMVTVLAEKRAPEKGATLIVAHGVSLDAGSRALVDKSMGKLSLVDLQRMGLHYPYCSCLSLQEKDEGGWSFTHDALPPINYLDFSNRVNAHFLNRA